MTHHITLLSNFNFLCFSLLDPSISTTPCFSSSPNLKIILKLNSKTAKFHEVRMNDSKVILRVILQTDLEQTTFSENGASESTP